MMGGCRGGPGSPGVSRGGPVSVLPWPTPLLGGGKGEVKPPKCPTRHPRVGGF